MSSSIKINLVAVFIYDDCTKGKDLFQHYQSNKYLFFDVQYL